MKNSLTKLAVALLMVLACAMAIGQGTKQEQLNKALAWLKKVQVGFTPDLKKDVPALQNILTRYYLDPESLRASEEDIALAFLDTMPKDEDLAGRGGTMDRLKRFQQLMGSAPPAPKPKTTTKPKTTPPKTPAPKVTVKRKIPGVHAKATFAAESRTAPGGKTIGVVQMSISGRTKTVVEVLSGTSKLDAKKRAQVVASRMQALSARNRLWWTMLRVSQVKGQYVVGTGGKDFVITADSDFAREWGTTPSGLARQLITKIRSSLDPEKSEQFGSRDLTPEELRIAAIDLRQQGDALYASNATGAEAKYRAAIANDPTYGIPYLRIADLCLAKKDSEGAKAILNQGIGVSAMPADQRASLEAKLKTIG